jgi:transposase
MAVDINGLPQAIHITRANVSDREGALAMFSLSNQMFDSVQRVIVDGGYTGNDFSDQVKLILDANTTVAKRNELQTFKVLPQRWIIELVRTCLVSFKNYLQEGQYNHLKTAVKGTFTVFPKSPTFV